MVSYCVMLDVPFQLAAFVAELLAGHRREIGTRSGTRALSCWKQAVFALAWFRDRPDVARLGRASGSPRPPPTATWRRPSPCSPGRRPTCAGPGWGERAGATLPDPGWQGRRIRPAERKAHQQERPRDRPLVFRQGARLRRQHPGAVHPRSIPLWVSPVLPGGVHDISATREHLLVTLWPFLKDLPVLADSGYEGAGDGVHIPVRKPTGGRELDPVPDPQHAAALPGRAKLRLISQRWQTLQRVMLSPGKIGENAQASSYSSTR